MSNNASARTKITPLFPKDFWDRPKLDPNEKGESNIDPLHLAVGRALSSWESAEVALGQLFLRMSECETPKSYDAVRRAFGSIESSSGRRKALEATAEIYFGNDWSDPLIKKPFKELMTAFEDASRRRDEIAHGWARGAAPKGENRGIFLFPPEYNTQRTLAYMGDQTIDPLAFMRAKFRYKASHIETFAVKFGLLGQIVLSYAYKTAKIECRPAILWLKTLHGQPEEMIDSFFTQHGFSLADLRQKFFDDIIC